MKYYKKEKIKIPYIGLGCMRMAGMNVNEVEKLIHGAVEMGINFFDHADIYGNGEAEIVFGKALKQSGILRKDVIIQSKCGIRSGIGYDLSKEYILESVDGILQRLGIERLDILLLHRPDALWELEEICEAFDLLYYSGKVRYFGVSNQNSFQMDLLQSELHQKLIVSQIQFSIAHCTMIHDGLNVNVPDEIAQNSDGGLMQYCKRNNILMQAWSPLQYGFFEGSFIDSPKYPELNNILEKIAQNKNVTKAAIALAWILRNVTPIQPIVGTMQLSHLEEAARACDISLSKEEWYAIYCAAGNRLP